MADVRTILTDRLERIKQRITDNLSQRKASGRTAASLQLVVSDTGGAIYGASHLLSLERGRGPGKIPYGFVDIIKQWIQDKGLSVTSKRPNASAESALNSMAGAIAYSIMKKGTTQFQKGRYEDIYTTAIEEETKALADEVSAMLSLEIDKVNEKYAGDAQKK